jgi:methylated-DNA-protein-cysteine methyltransferase-like protein
MAASESYKKIWEQAALIPEGQVASYGQIAKQAGLPRRGARMVARAVGAAPAEMQLPWHRIVNAQGRISIPRGSSRYEQQQELLRDEGVVVNNGQLDMDRYRWSPTLDELLWGPGMFHEPEPAQPDAAGRVRVRRNTE